MAMAVASPSISLWRIRHLRATPDLLVLPGGCGVGSWVARRGQVHRLRLSVRSDSRGAASAKPQAEALPTTEPPHHPTTQRCRLFGGNLPDAWEEREANLRGPRP